MSDVITVWPRTVQHISVDTVEPCGEFRAAYETAVPDLIAVFGEADPDDIGAGASHTLAGLLTHLGVPAAAELVARRSVFGCARQLPMTDMTRPSLRRSRAPARSSTVAAT